jgi:hypothetical protein
MSEGLIKQPSGDAEGTGASSAVAEFERAFQRNIEPFLQKAKQITLDVIEEAGRKHGAHLVTQMQTTLKETVNELVKVHIERMVEQLRPGGEAARAKAESLLDDLKTFVRQTVGDVFKNHVPDYSRWAGQRIIDYVLAGILFAIAAVLVSVGGILGLEQAGMPRYATYLILGGVAFGAGFALLRLRARKWGGPPRLAGAATATAPEPEKQS